MLTEELKQRILAKPFYSAREIALEGFILNNKRNPNDYFFIRKAIKDGKLRGINMNDQKKKPTFRVYSQDIITYLETC